MKFLRKKKTSFLFLRNRGRVTSRRYISFTRTTIRAEGQCLLSMQMRELDCLLSYVLSSDPCLGSPGPEEKLPALPSVPIASPDFSDNLALVGLPLLG